MRIGKVIVDETYYGGKDLYSDGSVEEEMLSLAESLYWGEISEEEIPSLIWDRKSWPLLYHFSPIREQILSWFPFTPEMDVLEVGSGCGAVTGALKGRVRSLTSVDLSLRRSRINALRHQDFEGLRILVGNFQDIEKDLGTFDVITLIGVFEYGRSYIGGEDPYRTFLEILKKHLRPGGRILIAIENRFGLKYWAGCTEDHSGVLFEGLEGYLGEGSARTFTKKEWEELALSAGFSKEEQHFYYPFPDYKFPQVLYSDGRLPGRGELNRTEFNLDRLRLSLFSESAVYDSLLDNDLFPTFSNSFLLILGGEAPEPVYVRFATEREERFQVRTELRGGPGEVPRVYKFPVGRGEEFLFSLPEKGRSLEKIYGAEGFFFNRVWEESLPGEGRAIALAFEKGESLEERLDGLLLAGKKEEVYAELLSYTERIRRLCRGETYDPAGDCALSADFVSIFGDVCFSHPMGALTGADLDLVPANIFPRGEEALVLDYEWTFFFPIPEDFLVFRFLHYYLESDGFRLGLLGDWGEGLYARAGLWEEDKETLTRMEQAFQRYILGACIPLRSFYPRISPGKLEAVPIYGRAAARRVPLRSCRVYFNRGGGFSEQDSFSFALSEEGEAKIPLPEGLLSLRLDPGEEPGTFRLEKLVFSGGEEPAFTTNGIRTSGNLLIYEEGDPQVIIEEIPRGAGYLSLRLRKVSPRESELWRAMQRHDEEQGIQIRRLQALVKERNEELSAVQGTKIWRLYRFLKKNPGEGTNPGLIYHLDREAVSEGKLLLCGWAVDEEGERVKLTLFSDRGEVLPAQEVRSPRPDVQAALGRERARGDLGFALTLPLEGVAAKKLTLRLEGSLGQTAAAVDLAFLRRRDSEEGRRREVLSWKNRGRLLSVLREGGLQGLRDFVDAESGTGERTYAKWLRLHRRSRAELAVLGEVWKDGPLFTVIALASPGRGRGSSPLEKSLKRQVYPHWELTVIPAEEQEKQAEQNRRETQEERALQAARAAKGEWILFARTSDVLEADALCCLGEALREAPAAYADEDVSQGGEVTPVMKPERNLFLLESQNYIGSFAAVRRELLAKEEKEEKEGKAEENKEGKAEENIEGKEKRESGEAASTLYESLLCWAREGVPFAHVSRVLVHRQEEERGTGEREELPALNHYLSHYEPGARAEETAWPGVYRVRRKVKGNPLVSLIVPLRDQPELLKALTASLEKGSYKNWELILVDNSSQDRKTLSLLRKLGKREGVRVLRREEPFNYPALNNAGARISRGEYLCLLNNDIEVLSGDWMEEMLSLCQLPQVGAVGAKLLYPDGTVQHAGVVLGLLGVAGHVLKDLPGEACGYGKRLVCTQEVSAVTGACLMVKRSVYESVGGLDPSLAVAFNDVDLCLRIREKGYQVLFTPHARLTHYESKSRGLEDTPEKQLRFAKECGAFTERWGERLREGDPFYSRNLTLSGTDCSLRWKEVGDGSRDV